MNDTGTARLFEFGGGFVTGTQDVAVARDAMQRLLRSLWGDEGSYAWWFYDFTAAEPVVEFGRMVPVAGEQTMMKWFARRDANSRGATAAVVWRPNR